MGKIVSENLLVNYEFFQVYDLNIKDRVIYIGSVDNEDNKWLESGCNWKMAERAIKNIQMHSPECGSYDLT